MMRKIILLMSVLCLLNVGAYGSESTTESPKFTLLIDLLDDGNTKSFEVDSNQTIQALLDSLSLSATKEGFVFKAWRDSTYINEGIDKDSIKITAKWEFIKIDADDKNTSSLDEGKDLVSEFFVKWMPMTTFVFSILALVLSIVILVLFLINKSRFRDNLIAELNKVDQGGRMDRWQSSIIEKSSKNTRDKISQSIPKSNIEDKVAKIEQRISNLESIEEGLDKEKKVEEVKEVQNKPNYLFADVIINGVFNSVTDRPNADTVFKLILENKNATTAKVVVDESAHKRIILRPEFLNECEKVIIGTSEVSVLKEGVATKGYDGKWTITTIPTIQIS